MELCGGTHVESTASIGLIKIISEGAVAAGVRRIEAITGLNSLKYMKKIEQKIEDTSEILKTDKDRLEEKAKSTIEQMKETTKELEKIKQKMAESEAKEIYSNPNMVKDTAVIIKTFKDKEVETLREIVDKIKDKYRSCLVVFLADNGNAVFMTGVSKDLIEKGIKAGDIVKKIAEKAGGKGGGRPDFAQAGGKDGSIIKDITEYVNSLIKEECEKI